VAPGNVPPVQQSVAVQALAPWCSRCHYPGMDNADTIEEALLAYIEDEERTLGVRLAVENGQLVEQDGFAAPCPCGLRSQDDCECGMGWER